jgi:hypothetical protein
MLDQVTIAVTDFACSKAFYDKALRPLGIKCLHTDGTIFAGYGSAGKRIKGLCGA